LLRPADVQHADVNARPRGPGGEFEHGLQFLCGGGQGGLDRGDLVEPALFPGFLKPVAQVGTDLFQSPFLGRVDPEEAVPRHNHRHRRAQHHPARHRHPARIRKIPPIQ
jgi:hypothetical protein